MTWDPAGLLACKLYFVLTMIRYDTQQDVPTLLGGDILKHFSPSCTATASSHRGPFRCLAFDVSAVVTSPRPHSPPRPLLRRPSTPAQPPRLSGVSVPAATAVAAAAAGLIPTPLPLLAPYPIGEQKMNAVGVDFVAVTAGSQCHRRQPVGRLNLRYDPLFLLLLLQSYPCYGSHVASRCCWCWCWCCYAYCGATLSIHFLWSPTVVAAHGSTHCCHRYRRRHRRRVPPVARFRSAVA